jgi:hypothetical protein
MKANRLVSKAEMGLKGRSCVQSADAYRIYIATSSVEFRPDGVELVRSSRHG